MATPPIRMSLTRKRKPIQREASRIDLFTQQMQEVHQEIMDLLTDGQEEVTILGEGEDVVMECQSIVTGYSGCGSPQF